MTTMPLDIEFARRCLQEGGIIAYPTEGVWGLGCDPQNEQAVKRLLIIKNRPMEKGLILVAATIEQLAPYLEELSASELAEINAVWPGPVTWVVPNSSAPEWLRGQHQSIALRVSAHPLVAQLCRAFGGPIVSTSANRAGDLPAPTISQVQSQLPEVDFFLPGELGQTGKPTEIRELGTNTVIRQ